jgi:hypothetical protein
VKQNTRPITRVKEIMNSFFCYCQALFLCYCTAFFKHNFAGSLANEDFPHEETFNRPAKLLRTIPAGDFTIGHYHVNPAVPPDYVSKTVSRFRSPVQGDHECLSWRILPITATELADWPSKLPNAVSEDLVALTDAKGNIIMFDYHTRAEAEVVMKRAART